MILDLDIAGKILLENSVLKFLLQPKAKDFMLGSVELINFCGTHMR